MQQPRQSDVDDDSIVHEGYTLSFRSTQHPVEESRLTMLERGLSALQVIVAKPILVAFVCLVCSRQLGKVGQERSEVKPCRGMQDAVSKGGAVAVAIQNFVSKADPALGLTLASVAKAMDSNCDHRNGELSN